MILSDQDILEIQNGSNPLLTPFNPERLGGASYDVSLGGDVSPILSISSIVDLSNRDKSNSLFRGCVPLEGFVMKPGQYCLAALAETISLPDDVVGFVLPRTRFTRAGLLVASQFCNPSYSGRLWIGLQNVSENNLRLAPNVPIAQFVFHRLSSTPSDERLYRNRVTATYQNENSTADGYSEVPPSDESKRLYQDLISELFGRGGR